MALIARRFAIDETAGISTGVGSNPGPASTPKEAATNKIKRVDIALIIRINRWPHLFKRIYPTSQQLQRQTPRISLEPQTPFRSQA
jgi:hypothetical protein